MQLLIWSDHLTSDKKGLVHRKQTIRPYFAIGVKDAPKPTETIIPSSASRASVLVTYEHWIPLVLPARLSKSLPKVRRRGGAAERQNKNSCGVTGLQLSNRKINTVKVLKTGRQQTVVVIVVNPRAVNPYLSMFG